MQPLHWPAGYKVEQYVPKEWFEHPPLSLIFFWASKPVWIYKDLFDPVVAEVAAQLAARPESALELWGNDQTRIKMSRYVRSMIKDEYNWPTDHFIPQDPFDIVFQMPFGGLEFVGCILRFKKDLGVNVRNKDTRAWRGKTLGDIVDFLIAKQSRQSH